LLDVVQRLREDTQRTHDLAIVDLVFPRQRTHGDVEALEEIVQDGERFPVAQAVDVGDLEPELIPRGR
jgi:hypothetical protein